MICFASFGVIDAHAWLVAASIPNNPTLPRVMPWPYIAIARFLLERFELQN